MKALLLAAGKGERLQPITETRSKPLVPILDKPLLLWHLENLERVVDKIYIVIRKEDRETISSLVNGHKVSIIEQKEGVGGTGTAFSSALSILNGDNFLLIYGDIFYDFSLLSQIVSYQDNIIVGKEVGNPRDFGVLKMSNNYLDGIIEKPDSPPSNLINAGIYKLSSDIATFVDKVKISSRGEIEFTDIINVAIKENYKVNVITYKGFWIDIGKPWHLLEANNFALSLANPNIKGEIEEDVRIKGKVIVEEGALIKSGSYIEGPAYIGKGATVGPNTYLREGTVLGKNTKAGSAVEIKNSIVMEDSKIPHLSYVGDSVICEDVNLGAGTLVANLRFDENHVKMRIKGKLEDSGRKKLGTVIGGHSRIGINVTILPGVKIGSYARIYPGAVVNRDVNKGEFFRT
ncbi:bifunctional sugar-1-phosphate nucleotidylyltransferase/acetyltransferase [Sulfuracidifex metallicus]|uniref:NTP transferase domain-containing protein n=1 Tax=Sulfuracidifex metallicus DSM 6482 = JCM 9184 TaxID=523847 RepID=A0A6A9QS11_SULME|nr:bifunctional sugar-1-phosphate nucleotidylyltransferase/acetyltransferase [Sulfuracidifex metallicus]MUN28583.1 NTP transferase domain-containing protein [Sulfuracidifex metallicus DSM 6482 = JCM 9184]WOE50884.1 bifunctional sugar-1-phosphate nucleotidylyltransferase/acetyltransferase [Sulfuracidifex metallicus DSM 6482 = JCM 9184]